MMLSYDELLNLNNVVCTNSKQTRSKFKYDGNKNLY